jgi:hypothetical protein
MTAAMLTQHYGCKRKMQIFIRIGMSDGNGLDQIAPAVGITQDMKFMHGCFRTVVWGALQKTIFKVNTNAIISDRTLGTWFTAFRSHLRWYFKLEKVEKAAKTDKRVLLNVVHKSRTPAWMRSISWHHPDYSIKQIDFAALPVKKQWKAVATANGFLGSDGAGFSQMVFLPAESSILSIALLERKDGSCHQAVRGGEEALTLATVNVAHALGLTYLRWKWCRQEVMENGFQTEHALKVLQLMATLQAEGLSTKTSKVCFVESVGHTGQEWPVCQKTWERNRVERSVLPGKETCGQFKHFGEAYGSNDFKISLKAVPGSTGGLGPSGAGDT